MSNLGISEKKKENTGFPVTKDRNIGERRSFLNLGIPEKNKTNPAIPEEKSENPAIPEAKTANIGIPETYNTPPMRYVKCAKSNYNQFRIR